MQEIDPPIIDYANARQVRKVKPRLRLGFVSLTLAVVAMIAAIVKSIDAMQSLSGWAPWRDVCMVLRAVSWAGSAGGFWTGILGVFQPSGRLLAVCGIVLSIIIGACTPSQ